MQAQNPCVQGSCRCSTVARTDIIVSLNLKHLANAWAEQRLNAVNVREGLPVVSIRTPEQVVHYED
jgi:hypothetical protein